MLSLDDVRQQQGQALLVDDLKVLRKMVVPKVFTIDIETSGAYKLPGDCGAAGYHGICGIGVCAPLRPAFYIAVRDKTNFGIPVEDVVKVLNTWCRSAHGILHNCKFDLSFLMSRGLECHSFKRITDTRIFSVLMNLGNYKSVKLKDIMAQQFGLSVDTKNSLEACLEEKNTRDYGEVPVERMAPYTCDDVRYTLFLAFEQARKCEPALKLKLAKVHDYYVQGMLLMAECESLGFAVRPDVFKAERQNAEDQFELWLAQAKKELGSNVTDLNDRQALLRYLHSQGLHSGPRQQYGETMFVADHEFLAWVGDRKPLARFCSDLIKRQDFLRATGTGKNDALFCRVRRQGEAVLVYPQIEPSISSRGFLIQTRKPEMENIYLKDFIHNSLCARTGNKFWPNEILKLSFPRARFDVLAKLNPAEPDLRVSPGVEKLCYQRQWEGSGQSVLSNRLSQLRSGASVSEALRACSEIVRHYKIPSTGMVFDLLGRPICLAADKAWRTAAVWWQSSTSGLVLLNLLAWNRYLKTLGYKLVFAHDDVFYFECFVSNKTEKFNFADVTSGFDLEGLDLSYDINGTSFWTGQFRLRR